ncbi:hypothetical protein L917_01955 [Phytophthora nicotianae]|uniref:Ubiquitin-like protease family profile domain-containing protein n=1 Tax=Phytophthora nicotianae TaxID=4792 RepID=W2LVG3_PHYNI|nr:hypothetical protein L917_01955 [Phytophthora nicotianae]
MADVERRSGFIDTSERIFSQMQANRIVCCPIDINVSFTHWCGIIFDMERQTVWTYDPFHREDFLSKLKDVFESRFGPIMATVMEVKTSQASYKTTVIAAEYWLFSGLNSTCLSPELLHPTRAFLFLAATNCTPTS